MDRAGPSTTKFQMACAQEWQNSIRCMEVGDKSRCTDLIETYKQCRKEEMEKQRAARASGGFKW